jgi:putative MATE family efflux protein
VDRQSLDEDVGSLAPAEAPPDLPIEKPLATWRQVLTLAWPVLLQQLLIYAVSLSDRILAGRFQPGDPRLHDAYQAAQTPSTYLSWLIASCTFLVSIGAQALVARFVGAGDRRAAVHVTNQALTLALLFGLLGTVAGLAFGDELIALIRMHGIEADLTASYLRPFFYLLVFQMVEMVGIACLAGAGDTRTGMWVLGGVAVLNLPLTWGLFLLPTRRGQPPWFEGIAWGSAVSNLIGCLVVLAVLARGRAGLRLDVRQLWPDLRLMWRLLRISVPAGIDSLSIVAGQFWFLSIVNQLGLKATAAHGLALILESISYLTAAAFGTAAMTLVGQGLGAGRPDQAAHSGWTALRMCLGLMGVMGVAFFVLAWPLFEVFCPNPEQRAIVETGAPVLQIIAFGLVPMGCYIICSCSLRGAGDTRVPVLFTWVGFLLVRIPLAYLLTQEWLDLGPLGTWRGFNLGLRGAWWAMFADLMVRGGFFLGRFAGGRWQRIRV